MIAHHQGAIDMAQVELKHGTDADAKRLAQQTIDENTKRGRPLRLAKGARRIAHRIVEAIVASERGWTQPARRRDLPQGLGVGAFPHVYSMGGREGPWI
jgi:hypothetical protein